MKAVIYLRIASLLTLLHAILHTIGGVFSKPEPGPEMKAVEAMKSNLFPLMGSIRSLWMFYRGMGLAVSIFLLAVAVVLWQLSSLAKTPYCLRSIYFTLLVAFIAMAVNSYVYFFWAPVVVELLIAICLAVAITASKTPEVQPG